MAASEGQVSEDMAKAIARQLLGFSKASVDHPVATHKRKYEYHDAEKIQDRKELARVGVVMSHAEANLRKVQHSLESIEKLEKDLSVNGKEYHKSALQDGIERVKRNLDRLTEGETFQKFRGKNFGNEETFSAKRKQTNEADSANSIKPNTRLLDNPIDLQPVPTRMDVDTRVPVLPVVDDTANLASTSSTQDPDAHTGMDATNSGQSSMAVDTRQAAAPGDTASSPYTLPQGEQQADGISGKQNDQSEGLASNKQGQYPEHLMPILDSSLAYAPVIVSKSATITTPEQRRQRSEYDEYWANLSTPKYRDEPIRAPTEVSERDKLVHRPNGSTVKRSLNDSEAVEDSKHGKHQYKCDMPKSKPRPAFNHQSLTPIGIERRRELAQYWDRRPAGAQLELHEQFDTTKALGVSRTSGLFQSLRDNMY